MALSCLPAPGRAGPHCGGDVDAAAAAAADDGVADAGVGAAVNYDADG